MTFPTIRTERKQWFIAHLTDADGLTRLPSKEAIRSLPTPKDSEHLRWRKIRQHLNYPGEFQGQTMAVELHYLKVKISDDLSGIASYRATINGRWVLMEYEPKDNTLTYDFEDLTLEGSRHDLEISVTDNVGNSTTFKAMFHRTKK